MQLNQLKPNTKRSRSPRVGRGGKRGKTSGRGTKGQKARAGRKLRPELRDIIKKLPKRRGYHFKTIAAPVIAVKLEFIEKAFEAGDSVTPATLLTKRLVRGPQGSVPRVKIMGDGSLTKKLAFSGCAVSAPARTKIEAAGGSIA